MEPVTSLWKEHNLISSQLSEALGRTSNIVGEYAEHLVNQHLNGTLLGPSSKSADIEKDGKLYQVKSRRLENGTTTQLSIIRSWDFDFLVTVLFDKKGNVTRANMVPASVAKENAVENEHQNGYVITTHRNFFNCRMNTDITDDLKKLNHEEVKETCVVYPIKSIGFKKLHRIEKWAINPASNNNRIIRAWLELEGVGDVLLDDMQSLCNKPVTRPGLFVRRFKGNFASMKSDAGHSHGKVFFEDAGRVFVYPRVLEEIRKHFQRH